MINKNPQIDISPQLGFVRPRRLRSRARRGCLRADASTRENVMSERELCVVDAREFDVAVKQSDDDDHGCCR